MRATLTVRASAARIGVHRDTAFRWRHRLLDAVRAGESTSLGGHVTVGETSFLFSEKGKRRLQRPARRHGSPPRWASTPRVWVLVAVDDIARTLHAVTGFRRCNVDDLEAVLAPSLAADTVLLTREGPLGAVGLFSRRAGLTYRRLPLVDPWREPAAGAVTPWRTPLQRRSRHEGASDIDGAVRRLKAWLRPFRGVATHYLANYLAWHRAIDRMAGGMVETAC